jgi:hypothetical protein
MEPLVGETILHERIIRHILIMLGALAAETCILAIIALG